MAVCRNCGSQMPDNARVCSRCGAKADINYQHQQNQYGHTYQQNRKTNGEPSFDPRDVEANKIYAVLSYFSILFFIPLVVCPNSRYARFHSNQGLILLILSVLLNIAKDIVNTVIGAVFTVSSYGYSYTNWFGVVLQTIIGTAAGLVIAVMFVIGVYNAYRGVVKELPLVGGFRLIK